MVAANKLKVKRQKASAGTKAKVKRQKAKVKKAGDVALINR
jgi:hypothetical protein